ncbi:uncharacterized protein EV420DRAFT_1638725 [Desarmillaria tabescens]|uniref:Uncharacterized protein n=1 Tax=Armillaria tabescens TaxID=1929756 RepID=A0AA39NDT5_ARMTA|nr:uncharacterized protein EV420DRAFT_1638725 [Desarmillaria tabescens]KAK0463810.1 hypothetical protein EV420DRAFT_1638725 [Desarmillaria tabescens]
MLALRSHLLSTDAFHRLISRHQYRYLNFRDLLPADSLLRVFSTQYCFENRHALLSLLSVLCLLLFVTISFVSKRTYKSKGNIHLKALSTVVIPTRNRSQSIKYTVNWKDRRMEVSLGALVEKVKTGAIEMRNPRADLSDMFRERSKVYGWTIGLHVEPTWSTKTMAWLLKDHFLYSMASKAPPLLLLSKGPSMLHLDVVPHSEMESSIASYIKSLAVGSTTTIEFTTISPHTAWMSKNFILCSLPLRTSTPLLVSLTGVLSVLTQAERLVEDRAERIAFIDRYGLDMWRERRFLMYWEAALLDAGHVTRWIVELQQ